MNCNNHLRHAVFFAWLAMFCAAPHISAQSLAPSGEQALTYRGIAPGQTTSQLKEAVRYYITMDSGGCVNVGRARACESMVMLRPDNDWASLMVFTDTLSGRTVSATVMRNADGYSVEQTRASFIASWGKPTRVALRKGDEELSRGSQLVGIWERAETCARIELRAWSNGQRVAVMLINVPRYNAVMRSIDEK